MEDRSFESTGHGHRGSVAASSHHHRFARALTKIASSFRLSNHASSAVSNDEPQQSPQQHPKHVELPRAARLTAAEHAAVVDAWVAQVNDSSVADSSTTLFTILHNLGIQINEDVEEIVEEQLTASEGRVALDHFVAIVEKCKSAHVSSTRRSSFKRRDLVEAFSALTGHSEPVNLQKERMLSNSSFGPVVPSPNANDETSGSLSKDEVKRVFSSFNMALDAEGLLRDLDKDHNSKVDFSELIELLLEGGTSDTPPSNDGDGSPPSGFRQARPPRRYQRKSVTAVMMEGSLHGSGGLGGGVDDFNRSVLRHDRDDLSRFVTKNPIAMTAFYRALQKAATNVSDMDEFRSRCGKLMEASDRQGDPRRTEARRPATAGAPGFSRLSADTRQRTLEVRNANRTAIEQRREKAKERQAVVTRDRQIQQALERKLEERLEDLGLAAAPQQLTAGRLLAQRDSTVGSSGRRSLRATSIGELEDIAAEVEADSDNSVYSTSSSQRSIDLKASGISKEASREGDQIGDGAALIDFGARQATPSGPFAMPPTRAASTRSRSMRHTRQSSAASTVSRGGAADKRTNLGDRRVLSTQILFRLTSNTNQARMLKIAPPPVVADSLKEGEQRRKQLPPNLITPKTREKKTQLSNETKIAICRADDYGEERLECDAKLYECYFGKT
jgi:Ca2+-binding EF-hand superfamily protein